MTTEPLPLAAIPSDPALPVNHILTLADSFRRHLDAGSAAPRTREIYGDAVRRLARYLSANGMPVTIDGVRREHLEAYMAELLATRSAATAAFHYRSLHRFFAWLVEEDEITASPMARMKPPKVDVKPPDVLTDDRLRALLATCTNNDFESRRDRALIRLLIDTGCRRGELVGLRWSPDEHGGSDVDMDGRLLRLRGKGACWRTVRFGKMAARELDRYTRVRARHPHADSPAMWLGKKGPLTGTGLLQMVRRRGRQAGIDGAFVQLLRHTFAHRWLQSEGTEGDLMTLAVWKSRSMLSRYGASAAASRAHAAHDRLSPGDRIG